MKVRAPEYGCDSFHGNFLTAFSALPPPSQSAKSPGG
ncbi:MAG: hypothetical protein ACI8T1_002903 [Verrucomicrobiales bacterium]|jgi:hypothetical protein